MLSIFPKVMLYLTVLVSIAVILAGTMCVSAQWKK
jgi:preprotein translocase subunit Sec61beta